MFLLTIEFFDVGLAAQCPRGQLHRSISFNHSYLMRRVFSTWYGRRPKIKLRQPEWLVSHWHTIIILKPLMAVKALIRHGLEQELYGYSKSSNLILILLIEYANRISPLF